LKHKGDVAGQRTPDRLAAHLDGAVAQDAAQYGLRDLDGVDLLEPLLDGAELEIVRQSQLAQAEQSRTDPSSLSSVRLSRTLSPYPSDDVRYRLTPEEEIQQLKTVTIEPFPHSGNLRVASVHPCKHASVMKKVIERMNTSIEEQQAFRKGSSSATKESKKKWGVFGGSSRKGGEKTPGAAGDEEEIEGLRVDFYLVVFLKFIASIVPTIEVDSTTAF